MDSDIRREIDGRLSITQAQTPTGTTFQFMNTYQFTAANPMHCFWQASDSVCTTVLTVTLSKKKKTGFFVVMSTTNPERARAETVGADLWVLKRREC